jgi:tRNA (guanine9-N1)-methyltransferase
LKGDSRSKKMALPESPVRRSEPTPPVPEGMSKSAWKRELKKRKFEEEKEVWIEKRKEKRKIQKLEKKKRMEEENSVLRSKTGEISETAVSSKVPQIERIKQPINIIIDCGFDELMKDRERVSLASQIVRCYSDNKKASRSVNLSISSLNKGLLERFDVAMKGQYKKWKDVIVSQKDFELSDTEKENCIYLSSDSSEVIEELQDHTTYIIGGIVDKGRYKNLCHDKAAKLGLRTGRLPIDQYIKLSGRKVLTTNHVFELLLKWLEVKDWKVAFESVLPQRKLIAKEDETKVGIIESEEADEKVEESLTE